MKGSVWAAEAPSYVNIWPTVAGGVASLLMVVLAVELVLALVRTALNSDPGSEDV